MKNRFDRRKVLWLGVSVILLCGVLGYAAAQKKSAPTTPVDPLIAGFKKSYPASVSDAVELVTGKNGTMWHDMKLVYGTPIVGRAVTSLVKPASPEQATPALSTKHSVEMIDNAEPGEVGVIVMEGSLEIAAMGNLMATVARNVPVECAGVTVRPGDIIVADEDGVVVVPQERAQEVLKKAQEIDDRERGMFPFIKQHKSLQKAIEAFNRI